MDDLSTQRFGRTDLKMSLNFNPLFEIQFKNRFISVLEVYLNYCSMLRSNNKVSDLIKIIVIMY